MTAFSLSAATLALFFAGIAQAGQQDAVQSCYQTLGIPTKSQTPRKEIFLVIDQTTVLDERLKTSVLDNVRRNLAAGNAFTVIGFSAFIQNHYTDVIVSGRLDQPMSQAERDDTGKSRLRELDKCMGAQLGYAQKLAVAAANNTFGSPTANIAKSDVLASLRDIARNKITPSPAKEKVVLIVSDMLENSSVASFYASNTVRKIDSEAELKKVAAAKLDADFSGARIYVLGAGVTLVDAKNARASASYRDPKTMQALKAFWQGYFQKSGAVLVEFGQPALLGQVD